MSVTANDKLPQSTVDLLNQILDRRDWSFSKSDVVETASVSSNDDDLFICKIRWLGGNLSTINFLDANHIAPSVIIDYKQVLNAGLYDKVKKLHDELRAEYQEPIVDINGVLSRFIPEE